MDGLVVSLCLKCNAIHIQESVLNYIADRQRIWNHRYKKLTFGVFNTILFQKSRKNCCLYPINHAKPTFKINHHGDTVCRQCYA